MFTPSFYGRLTEKGSRAWLFDGHLFGAAVVGIWIGVQAEGKTLEDIAVPLATRK